MSTIMAIQFVVENHWLAFGRKAPRLHLHPAGCLFLSYSSGKTSLVRGQYKLEADAMICCVNLMEYFLTFIVFIGHKEMRA